MPTPKMTQLTLRRPLPPLMTPMTRAAIPSLSTSSQSMDGIALLESPSQPLIGVRDLLRATPYVHRLLLLLLPRGALLQPPPSPQRLHRCCCGRISRAERVASATPPLTWGARPAWHSSRACLASWPSWPRRRTAAGDAAGEALHPPILQLAEEGGPLCRRHLHHSRHWTLRHGGLARIPRPLLSPPLPQFWSRAHPSSLPRLPPRCPRHRTGHCRRRRPRGYCGRWRELRRRANDEDRRQSRCRRHRPR